VNHHTVSTFQDVEACVDQIIASVGKQVSIGLPLGLAKPVHLVNALYRRAKQDPEMTLKIITAISLEKPVASSDLERRFIGPLSERMFGGVPELDYTSDMRHDQLAKNVEVTEFYFKPASFLNHKMAQQNYISTNYTHAPRDVINYGVNVVAQSIAKREVDGQVSYSLSSNSDVCLDIIPLIKQQEQETGKKVLVVGQVNSEMPFMYNDAEVEDDAFDMIIDNRSLDHRLFNTPNRAITPTDHMIGFNASTLLKDGGTLQIGIGSLGDALINATIMRHERNAEYCEVMQALGLEEKYPVVRAEGEHGVFDKGLYGNTEMLVHGYMSLYKAGILKRKVYDNLYVQQLVNEELLQDKITPEAFRELIKRRAVRLILTEEDVAMLKQFGFFREQVEWSKQALSIDGNSFSTDMRDEGNLQRVIDHCLGDKLKNGVVLHGAFFLGPESFYDDLRNLTEEQSREINMTAISYTNGLFGQIEQKNAQRRDARYINTCMKMTLLGAAASDGLENGQVVSGVGGQYNFVAMAHEEPGARSILLLKSTRNTKDGPESNIVFNYGYITIPRHLRDIVITEYGVADLRGKCDGTVIKELIQIADSRFQEPLVEEAKQRGKLEADYQVPEIYRHNTPQRLAEVYNKFRVRGCFEPFPFSCDFTQEELMLGKALKSIKSKSSHKWQLVKTLWNGLMLPEIPEQSRALIARMDLEHPENFKQKLMQRLILGELNPKSAKPDKAETETA